MLDTVTADVNSATDTLKLSRVPGGSDVAIYVSEVHALASVLEPLDG